MATLEASGGVEAAASAGALPNLPWFTSHMGSHPMTTSGIASDELQTMRTQLLRARLSGVERTQHGDKMVVYKDDQQMTAALAAADQAIANAGRPAVRTIHFLCSKGLD